MKYNGVHNSWNEVLFKIFAEDTITSAEKNDTPYNSPSVLYKKVLNFWIEIWIENLVDWPKKQKL